MTIDEMQKRRQKLRLTYKKLSELSGIPVPTVKKILGGSTRSPRHETIVALERVLGAGENRLPGHQSFPEAPAGGGYQSSPGMPAEGGSILQEAPAPYGSHTQYQWDSSAQKEYPDCYPLLPYKRQGEYTEEDRDNLPDEYRTELIDGVLYDLASPATLHQVISMEISFQLRSQIDICGKDCLVFAAPSDVKISGDNQNILQPDIYVICDHTMLSNKKNTVGAPPFVIEILSPSTRGKDMLLKGWKYATSGVKEYWIVDPDKRCIIVRDYEKDPQGTESVIYTFDDSVPVGISGGHCRVDFASIRDLLDRLGL